MKASALLIVISILLPNLITGEPIDPDAKLAEWDGGFVTVADYREWWQRMDPKERPALRTIDEKRDYLDKIIDVRLMLAGAESLALDTLPKIRMWLEKQRISALKKALEDEAITADIRIDPLEVERELARQKTTIVARHIVVPTADLAAAILDSIKAGVPFENLAYRYSTDASAPRGGYLGEVKWGYFSEKWCERAFALQPGQVSDPMMTESGYLIIKVEDRREGEIQNPETERRRIEYNLYKQRFMELSNAFRDSLYNAYKVGFDDAALIKLVTRYAQKMEEMGIFSTVIDVDVIPDLTESEKLMDVVKYEGGSFTMGEIVDMILSFPYPVRPRYDDPDGLVEFLTRQLNDTLYVVEAMKRRLDTKPEVRAVLEKTRQQRLTTAFFGDLTADVTVPEDTLRFYFEKNREEFRISPGYFASKIVVGTKEAADSVLLRLKNGERFEDIASLRSRDPFTAPKGGDMGFSPLGKDEEFDGFIATMNEGETGVFRSIEGWVVLWLRERRQDRLPEYEEVRDRIKMRFLPRYKDAALQAWLSNRREQIGLRINYELLSRVNVAASD